jgi:hypothetical protein
MLFIPSVVVFLLTKRLWLKLVAGFVWFLGLVINPEGLYYYLIATVIVASVTQFIRWFVSYLKRRTNSSE